MKGPGQVQNDINISNADVRGVHATLTQFLNTEPAAGVSGDDGQPADPARRWRPALRAADLRPRQRQLGLPAVAGHRGGFGDKLAWSDTLTGALDGLFGGNSGATAGDSGSSPTKPGTKPTPGTTPSPGTDAAALAQALKDLQAAFDDGQKALKDGDFAAYGQAQKRLDDAIRRAVEAAPKGGSATP